jgi:DNA repair protein RecO (recombination protein O)
MQIKTDGLIVRDLNVGEDDRIVTILTRELGIVQASARGARRVKSRLSTATRLFCYSDFTLFKGRETYIIDDVQPIEFFLGVDKDLERLALAQYFAQLCAFLAPQEESAELFLRLMLNALSFLQNGKRPLPFIKAAFELRMLTMSGYMPDIVACRICGAYEADRMTLDPVSGTLICCDCRDTAPKCEESAPDDPKKPELSKGALAAMRHIVYADFERLFSFALPDAALSELSLAVQEYLLCRIERTFPTLEFYNSLITGG